MFFPISHCLTGHLITYCAFYLTRYIMIHCEVHTQFKAYYLIGPLYPTVHFILTGIPGFISEGYEVMPELRLNALSYIA